MSKKKNSRQGKSTKRSSKREEMLRPSKLGQTARSGGQTLRSYTIGALPIINRLLKRMKLDKLLREYLPPSDVRTRLAAHTGLLLLVRNVLCSREPVYGVGEWAERHAADAVGISPSQRRHLNDDRLGRCLDLLFEANQSELVLAVVRHVVKEFNLRLDELHNDSTTVSFFGAYRDAALEGSKRGRSTLAVTYGHSKARRPDLKQLLYVLTVTEDGGVPIYFTSKSGNVTDDKTHQETWELLCELVGRRDFLYVADCKLATIENMRYIDRKGGRFISVLPASRKEDKEFRNRLLSEEPDALAWEWLYDVRDDEEDEESEIKDRLSVWPRETVTSDGYRLWWFHSTRKAELDRSTRMKQIERAVAALNELRSRLTGPRTRFRQRDQVQQAVAKILDDETNMRRWLKVGIQEWNTEKYRQTKAGRPSKDTQYIKQEVMSFDLCWEIDAEALAEQQAVDGVFPLITNVSEFTAQETLQAYKRQPVIEKRFSQMKTDFSVAPVYLKSVSRIQALLCVYFFALLVQALLERELRAALQASDEKSLPLYPEARPCRRPTARRVLDIFEPIQRHTLTNGREESTFVTELSFSQERILELLGISSEDYAG